MIFSIIKQPYLLYRIPSSIHLLSSIYLILHSFLYLFVFQLLHSYAFIFHPPPCLVFYLSFHQRIHSDPPLGVSWSGRMGDSTQGLSRTAWRMGELSAAQLVVLEVWSNFRPSIDWLCLPQYTLQTPHASPTITTPALASWWLPARPAATKVTITRESGGRAGCTARAATRQCVTFDLMTFIWWPSPWWP